MYHGKTLYLKALDDHLAELCFDRQGDVFNKFDITTVNELSDAITVLEHTAGLRGVLISSAKDAFVVGADIFEFTELFVRSEAELAAHNLGQSRVFSRLAALPVPLVCEINGLALGGGFEVSLACDYRVVGDNAKVGLPEIGLGFFPGLGGMARLPRLVGAQTTIDWVLSGKAQDASAALLHGAVDRVVSASHLHDAALELLREAAGNTHGWQDSRQRRVGGFALLDEQVEAALAEAARLHPHVPAAGAAIRLLQSTAAIGLADALLAENRAFAAIAQTQAAHALMQLFVNDQLLRRKARNYSRSSRPVTRAAVLGAGIMGGGIAYTSAAKGIGVLMKDITPNALELGMGEASKLLDRQVTSGRLSQDKADHILAAITPTLSYTGFNTVEVVVEAVVESLSIKQTVLAAVEQVVGTDTVLASNTSSLSIGEIGRALERPENFVGMHFFNPVPLMPLVEVIRGPRTSDAAAATIAGYASSMGKTAIVVQDCPGFLVNRILTANVLGFLRLVHDGADFRQVDAELEAFGWPMGPAYLQDVIGMDTSEHVIDFISAGYQARMAPEYQHAVKHMVANGRLGQKNGKGFYLHERDERGRLHKRIDPDVTPLLAKIQANGPRAFSPEEMVDRVMLPMVIEAIHCLEQSVAESAVEIDMALVLGLGFPRHVGGPLKYADWLGPHVLLERCEQYAHLGPLYAPTAQMRERAITGARYY
ncbi:fatty acid oxidation complex subunit alpha FadB [Pseudomonas silvicola]|nr:fatty acid oxidation complex subunit alpha FadB [Pseudomonas silvicola]